MGHTFGTRIGQALSFARLLVAYIFEVKHRDGTQVESVQKVAFHVSLEVEEETHPSSAKEAP